MAPVGASLSALCSWKEFVTSREWQTIQVLEGTGASGRISAEELLQLLQQI